jgi:hypothetical protein
LAREAYDEFLELACDKFINNPHKYLYISNTNVNGAVVFFIDVINI